MSTILLNSLNVSKSVTNTTTTQISGLTTLNGSIDDTTTTIDLTSTAQTITSGGTILIDNEYITYTGVSNNLLSGVVRGAFGSIATSHLTGTSVYGVFIGQGELNPQPNVACSMSSDTSGLLFFQYSNDGIIYGTFPTNGFNIVANINEFQTGVKLLRYFRIVFKNLSSNKTTTFNSSVYYGTFGQSQLPLNQNISDDYTSTLVRSVNTGQSPTNTFDNFRSDGYTFQTTTPLSNAQSYTSNVLSTSGYSQIQTELYSDVSGVLTGTWYTESTGTTNPIRTFTRPYDASNGYAYFSSPVFGPYIKYSYTTDASQNEFYLGLKFLTKSISGQIVNLDDFIASNMVANLGRNVIAGETDGGNYLNVPVTNEGHLEVAIHDPINPFYSLHTEAFTPLSQNQGVYAYSTSTDPSLNPLIYVSYTIGDTAITETIDNMITSQIGTAAGYKCARVSDRKNSTYSPGQGLIVRFTGIFDTPVNGVGQRVGITNGQDTLAFGYNGISSEFGIIYESFGVLPVWSFTVNTVTNPSSTTITLNGVPTTIALTTTSATEAAYLLSKGVFNGWTTYVLGSTIYFQYFQAITTTTCSVSGTGITFSTPTNTIVGVLPTTQFIPQSQWNLDKCNGTGNSGFSLDPSKGNVFEIGVQYLGFGTFNFKVEAPASNTNNSTLVNCNVINNPNSRSKPTLSVPSFNFVCQIDSSNNSITKKVSSGSFGIFCEGIKKYFGNTFNHTRQVNGSAALTALAPIYSIQNNLIFNTKLNKKTISIQSIRLGIRLTSNNTGISNLFIYKNAILSGPANFQVFNASYSCSSFDTGASSFSGTTPTNEKLLYSYTMIDNDTLTVNFAQDELNIYPGEVLSFALNFNGNGTIDRYGISINTREDD